MDFLKLRSTSPKQFSLQQMMCPISGACCLQGALAVRHKRPGTHVLAELRRIVERTQIPPLLPPALYTQGFHSLARTLGTSGSCVHFPQHQYFLLMLSNADRRYLSVKSVSGRPCSRALGKPLRHATVTHKQSLHKGTLSPDYNINGRQIFHAGGPWPHAAEALPHARPILRPHHFP